MTRSVLRLGLCLLALSGTAAKKSKASKSAPGETLATALARGDELRQKGAYDQAAQAYKAAAKLEPARAEPHFFLGMNARAEGRTDAAMTHYKEALRMSPQLAEAHMNLASLLSQLPGSEEGALDHYAKALELREWPLDLSSQAEYNSGICLYNLQRTGEAQAALERALAQAPTFAPARELLEQIELEAADEAGGAESDTPVEEELSRPAPQQPLSEGGASSASSSAAAASAAEPPRRTAWRQAGGESACEGGSGATSLESAMAQLELQVTTPPTIPPTHDHTHHSYSSTDSPSYTGLQAMRQPCLPAILTGDRSCASWVGLRPPLPPHAARTSLNSSPAWAHCSRATCAWGRGARCKGVERPQAGGAVGRGANWRLRVRSHARPCLRLGRSVQCRSVVRIQIPAFQCGHATKYRHMGGSRGTRRSLRLSALADIRRPPDR